MTSDQPLISVITAVHNQRDMNALFCDSLRCYTEVAYELIVIDNASTDGSGELLASRGARVIRNAHNYSYPYTQNQGIDAARGRIFAFLNNDVVVGPQWDHLCIEALESSGLDVICAAGVERAESPEETERLKRRWKRIKNPLLALFGASEANLRRMMRWMYGDWERYCLERAARLRGQWVEGFVGCAVMTRRDVIDRIGRWDPRVQVADFDLYLRSVARHLSHGDVQPVAVLQPLYIHHFIRLTLKARRRPPQFYDAGQLITLEQKWSEEQLDWLQRIGVDHRQWAR
jgi:GT2 family glycosyltransferase